MEQGAAQRGWERRERSLGRAESPAESPIRRAFHRRRAESEQPSPRAPRGDQRPTTPKRARGDSPEFLHQVPPRFPQAQAQDVPQPQAAGGQPQYPGRLPPVSPMRLFFRDMFQFRRNQPAQDPANDGPGLFGPPRPAQPLEPEDQAGPAAPAAPVAQTAPAEAASEEYRKGIVQAMRFLKDVSPGHSAAVRGEAVAAAEMAIGVRVASKEPYPVDAVINHALDHLATLPEEPRAQAPQPPAPAKLIPEDVRDRVLDMFPKVDPAWVAAKAVSMTLDNLVAHILDPAKNVPKKAAPKASSEVPEEPAAVASRPAADQVPKKMDPEGERRYLSGPLKYQFVFERQKAGEKAMAMAFPLVALPCLRSVLAAFGNNWAPAYAALHRTLAQHSLLGKAPQGSRPLKLNPFLFPGPDLKPNFSSNPVRALHFLKRGRRVVPDTAAKALERFPTLAAEVTWTRAFFEDEAETLVEPEPEADSEEPTRECEICCEERKETEFVECASGHGFCRACVGEEARQVVHGRGGGRVECLEAGCGLAVAEGVLAEVLTATEQRKLAERSGAMAVVAAGLEGFEGCRFCAWGAVLASAETDKVFRCGGCEAEYCRLCGREWEEHAGLRCAELEEDKAGAERRRKEEALTAAILRKCHKCALQFQKETGCNRMTCVCGATSCYLCLAPDITYEHFCRHPLDPGAKCQKCKACLLWEAPDRIDQHRLAQAQAL